MVTKVSLQVPPAPKAVHVALVGLESFDKVQEVRKGAMVYYTRQQPGGAAGRGRASWGLHTPTPLFPPFSLSVSSLSHTPPHAHLLPPALLQNPTQMVVLAKRSLGEILSAMELMDAHSLDLVVRKPAFGLRNPLLSR